MGLNISTFTYMCPNCYSFQRSNVAACLKCGAENPHLAGGESREDPARQKVSLPNVRQTARELVRLWAVRKPGFSWGGTLDFVVLKMPSMNPVGEVKVWGRDGLVSVGEVEHKISWRYGLLQSQAFMVEDGGSVLARAQCSRIFRQTFSIEHGGKQYALKPRREGWLLSDGEREIGTLAWEGGWFILQRLRMDLPDDLPLVLALFVVWLLESYNAED
jgi:hypothetical protein